ncbi:MAG TPA: ADOP family duplicated permease [Thermoanaerobaculia bacterium]|nr:ADOP family duplicated permease [Thermoanaerobaculia bacterium]
MSTIVLGTLSSLYRSALSLYPEPLRREREELGRLFDDLLERQRRRSPLAATWFALRSLADVILVGLPARVLEALGLRGASGRDPGGRRDPQRSDRWLQSLLQDLGYAHRHFQRRPLVALASIGSLALGIAATTAIFSLFDALVLRPVAVAHPDRLVGMVSLRENGTNSTFPYPDFQVVRPAVADALDLVAYSNRPTTVRLGDGPEAASERLYVALVSAGYFTALEVDATLGRVFDQQTVADGSYLAVASHSFWSGRLSGEPAAIGRTFVVNDQPVTLIGVAPPGFRGLHGDVEPALYLPLSHQPVASAELLEAHTTSWLFWAGVLEPGASRAEAEARLEAVTMAHWQEIGRDFELGIELQHTPTGFPLPLRDYRPFVQLSMAVVVLVLLVACANVASLLLASGASRMREIGARQCLGAGRGRLVRQLLTESLLLGLVAGAAGVTLALLLVRALVGREPLASQLGGLEVGIDARVLGVALALTLAVSILFGLAPALQLLRRNAAAALRGAGGSAEHGRLLGQRALVVAQIALSFATLVLAALFAVSLRELQAIDPGIERAPVLMASIDLEAAGYEGERVGPFFAALLENVSAIPGVESAALTRSRPVSPAGSRMGYEVPGYVAGPDEDMELDTNVVSQDYFLTLGIELEEGRTFEPLDAAPGTTPVAVVNRIFAERFLSGRNPVGRTITSGMFMLIEGSPEVRVIGVVADGKYRSLREEPRPMVYLPHERVAAQLGDRMTLLVRTAGDPLAVHEEVRAAVHSVDPRVPPYSVITLEEQLERAVANERLTTALLGALAAFAVLLAGVGLFALLTYWTRLRRPEIGIRVALGARPGEVVRGVVSFTLALVAAGCVAGVALAMPLARVLEAQLYSIQPTNPAVYVAGAFLLLAIGALAGALPSHQTARVDPVKVLRQD